MKERRKRNKPELPPEEKVYRNTRRTFRSISARHVFVAEADLNQTDKVSVFGIAERARKASNELTGVMRKRLDQMRRLRKYKGLCKALKKLSASDRQERKRIRTELDELREEYQLTETDCRHTMEEIAGRYGLHSVFGRTLADDVFAGVEKVLYGNGHRLHFHKRGEYPALRAKQPERAIVLKERNGGLTFTLDGLTFGLKKKPEDRDQFESDEIASILSYMQHADAADREAVSSWQQTGRITDTFRPCYVSLVCKEIRGKLRVYVHITVEGKAAQKKRADGSLRHPPGTGRVGADIGTQTIAWTSDTETGLINLAERGDPPERTRHELQLIDRKMERSRRLSNPQNFNPDGTIKRGVKLRWTYSKRYLRLRERKRRLERRVSVNRHLAANELAHHLRSLGDTLITEPKNADRLARRAKRTTYNRRGHPNRKKRFGKSIHRRIPGYVQAQIQKIFEGTGGEYHEVPAMYRASQFDHTSGTYHKKALSTRAYRLADKSFVQRDWYSSFLLYCADTFFQTIDRTRCIRAFPAARRMQLGMIAEIRRQNKKVLNSGIYR